MNLAQLLETLRAFRAGAQLGDVAVLKLDTLSTPPRGIAARLERVRGHATAQNRTATHDLHHCLLGFDAGLAGEGRGYAFLIA